MFVYISLSLGLDTDKYNDLSIAVFYCKKMFLVFLQIFCISLSDFLSSMTQIWSQLAYKIDQTPHNGNVMRYGLHLTLH